MLGQGEGWRSEWKGSGLGYVRRYRNRRLSFNLHVVLMNRVMACSCLQLIFTFTDLAASPMHDPMCIHFLQLEMTLQQVLPTILPA